MRINAEFTEKAVVVPKESDWVCSPESGVDRLMLDRIGDEVARATSIVRYAAGSSFSRHEHGAGEEFLVLDGVFSDEHADYGAGTYVRNPPGSGHSPYSRNGCRLLVKLRQIDPQDLSHVVVDTADEAVWPKRPGSNVLELHRFGSERVMMIRLDEGEPFPIVSQSGGLELMVISGSINDEGTELTAESWLRIPADQENRLVASSDSLLWVKTGHLPS
ncbi:MAG: cupin domain-containing protein [Woeseiaceae bacterium]